MQFAPIDQFGGGFVLFITIIGWVGACAMLVGCTLALSIGGRQERIAATAYLLSWILSTLARLSIADPNIAGIVVMLIDISLLLTFTALVWKAPHNWLVWATSFQLLVATLQFLYLTDFAPSASAYSTILNFTSLGIIVAMIVGSIAAWTERAVIASQPDELGRYS